MNYRVNTLARNTRGGIFQKSFLLDSAYAHIPPYDCIHLWPIRRFRRPNQQNERRIQLVVLITALMMVIEILAGWQYHSMALLADGWHMGTHVLALGVSLLAYVLSRRFAGDHRFAFGTWKIEILGAYTSALLLAIVALSMIWESVERLLSPGEINYGESILVAFIGLVVNLISAWLLGGDHHHHGHHHHDMNTTTTTTTTMTMTMTMTMTISMLTPMAI